MSSLGKKHKFWIIPLVYLLLGIWWVFTTDYLLQVAQEMLQIANIRPVRIVKSLTFVVTTTVLLYFMLRRYTRRLEASEAYYRVLYDATPVSILIADLSSGHITEANPSAQRVINKSLPELQNVRVHKLLVPYEGQEVKTIFDADSTNFKSVGIWLLQNEAETPMYVNCYTTKVQTGGREQLLLGIVNVTQMVEARQEASNYADMLFEMQEKISDAYIILNKDYRVVRVNNAFIQMLGVTKEYILGSILWDAFPNSKSTQFYNHYKNVLENQISVHFEDYYPEMKQWYRVSAYPTPEGLVAYLRDITREKGDQARIEESDRNLNAVINNTTDAIWYVTADLRVGFRNAAFERIRGELPIDTLTEGNVSITKAHMDGLAAVLHEKYKQGLAGERVEFTYNLKYKNGYDATYEIIINPIKNGEGSITGIGCFGRDVTQRVRAEQLVKSKTERLRRIAWVQSHEVRGPVASILGLTKIFNYENLQDSENATVVLHLRTVAEKLDGVVRSIVEETLETS